MFSTKYLNNIIINNNKKGGFCISGLNRLREEFESDFYDDYPICEKCGAKLTKCVDNLECWGVDVNQISWECPCCED